MLMEALLSTVSVAALKTALIFMPVMVSDTGTTAFQIQRSLRFKAASSAQLNKSAFSSGGDRQKMTFSFWMKRSGITPGGNQYICTAQDVSNNMIVFHPSVGSVDQIGFLYDTVAGSNYVFTTMLFRDPGAWYHVMLAIDTTQATAANRCIFYVNGVQVAMGGTQPAQNRNLNFGFTGTAHTIGGGPSTGGNYFDGYLAEYHYVNGSQLTPSSFGETDAITGQWVPKAFAGPWGTNGHYLDFSDPSSAANLCLDRSGNGVDYTPTAGVSVTAGTTYDSMVDSPTNYGNDSGTGGEVRGNYCTLSPLARFAAITFSNGNLTAAMPTTATASVQGTIGFSSGKYYFEAVWSAGTSANGYNIGVATPSWANKSGNPTGPDTTPYSHVADSRGNFYNNGTSTTGFAFNAGDVVGCAVDADALTVAYYKNGVKQGSDQTLEAGQVWLPFFYGATAVTTLTVNVNFGQRAFNSVAPSGFKALCTQNLPDPAIVKPSQYFNAKVYTGNHAVNAITGVGHQPDFIWFKNRPNAFSNFLLDAVRGGNNQLFTEVTAAENASTANCNFTSYDSDGFTLGASSSTDGINNSGTANNQVAWCWKEGTTPGFDIVTFTAPGSGTASPAHNLGVAPHFVIVKCRGTTGNWNIWHRNLANATTAYIMFTTAAATTFANMWGASGHDASNLNFGVGASVVASQTHVAYAFREVPGFSRFDKYIGNGAADGPFVWCGFRPRWIAMKRYDGGTESWFVIDAARDDKNIASLYLRPDMNAAEASTGMLDILSNGFKLRLSASNPNTNASSYLFAAFAENPFKYARAR